MSSLQNYCLSSPSAESQYMSTQYDTVCTVDILIFYFSCRSFPFQGNSTLVRPPPKNSSAGADGDLYDSCVDNPSSPSLYVVFDSNQIYPKYLIEYSVSSVTSRSQTATRLAGRNVSSNQASASPSISTSFTSNFQHSSASVSTSASTTASASPRRYPSSTSASTPRGYQSSSTTSSASQQSYSGTSYNYASGHPRKDDKAGDKGCIIS